MIDFEKYILPNGLRLLVHCDSSTPMVAFNVLYDVGSRDEDPLKTGYAHLFEHLMFSGSAHVPNYDQVLQRVGGDNNAFTSKDITNYYITLPAQNVETAFWLESDRMHWLTFEPKALEVQRNVVIEEFNQHYNNQPYGDAAALLASLAYKTHPYRWHTIGMSVEHIAQATMHDLKNFYRAHYAPNQAILSIAGPVKPADMLSLSEKWFGPIESPAATTRSLPAEPLQTQQRLLEVERDVPFDAIYKAYHTPQRRSNDFYTVDLISDLLAAGKSSRLFAHLVRDRQLFSNINAYVTGDLDPGLLVINGHLYPNVTFTQAEAAIDEELEALQNSVVEEVEMEKVKNRYESNFNFEAIGVLNKAMSLAYHELMGDAATLNAEVEKYRKINSDDVHAMAKVLFDVNNCSTVRYKAK